MPYGYFTILSWKGKKAGWVVREHVAAPATLSDALARLESRGEAGLYKLVQTQRVVWAEKSGGRFQMRKWHCGSFDPTMRLERAFDRDKGVWPVKRASEEARAMRRARARKAK